MSRFRALAVCVGLLLTIGPLFAQQRPDFSGHWVMVSPLDGAEQEQVVTQDATTLTVAPAAGGGRPDARLQAGRHREPGRAVCRRHVGHDLKGGVDGPRRNVDKLASVVLSPRQGQPMILRLALSVCRRLLREKRLKKGQIADSSCIAPIRTLHTVT